MSNLIDPMDSDVTDATQTKNKNAAFNDTENEVINYQTEERPD